MGYKNTKKGRPKRRIQNRITKKQRGGFLGFSNQNVAIIEKYDKTTCQDSEVKCNFFDTQFSGKLNPTWNTCINMNNINNHILYITQTNVLIKSIESMQIPQFMVGLGESQPPVPCKVMIEDKFVSCFLLICNEWYVIMRLFGKTLNRMYFARTEKNKVFYKLKNININASDPNVGNGTGLITFPTNSYTELNISYIMTTDKNSKHIQLKEDFFTNINKKNSPQVFKVLQRFRQQKIFANAQKQAAAQDAAEFAAEEVVDLFNP